MQNIYITVCGSKLLPSEGCIYMYTSERPLSLVYYVEGNILIKLGDSSKKTTPPQKNENWLNMVLP